MKEKTGLIVSIVLGVILLLAAFVMMRGCDKRIDKHTIDTSLPPNVAEKIVVIPTKHQLIIAKPEHQQTIFLPDRPSSIEIDKKGQVVVTSKQFGTELRPFFGVQVANQVRLGAGVDVLYFKKLDLGLGVADKVGMYTPVALVKVSYIVWSNSSLGITFDSSTHVGVMLSVRL